MNFYKEILRYIEEKAYPIRVLKDNSFAFIYEDRAFIILKDSAQSDFVLLLIMPKIYIVNNKNRETLINLANASNNKESTIKTVVRFEEVFLSTHIVENANKKILESYLIDSLETMIRSEYLLVERMKFIEEQENNRNRYRVDEEYLYSLTNHPALNL